MENPNGFFERFEKAPHFNRVVPIIRLKGGERIEVTILSQRVRWKTVHWTGNKTRPHDHDSDKCEGCRAEHPKRLYGYLAVLNGSKGTAILQLTHLAGETLEQQLAEHDSMRGIRIRVYRKNDKINGQMMTEYLQTLSPNSGVPKDIDPEPTLKRLWGITE